MQLNISRFLPHRMLFWIFFSSTINEATELFRSNGGFCQTDQTSLSSLYIQVVGSKYHCDLPQFGGLFSCDGFFHVVPGWKMLYIFPGFVIF